MIVRAARDINKGEQITHAYCQTTNFTARRQTLLKTWGFACDCSLCTIESLETPVVRRERQTQLATILQLESADQHSASRLSKGIQLVECLKNTYKKPATEQPRHTLFEAFRHLAEMKQETTLYEILVTLHGALEALGYKIEESQGRVFIARHGSLSNYLPEIFNQYTMAYILSGNSSMAKSYNELAASFYEVIFGEKESFVEKYPSSP